MIAASVSAFALLQSLVIPVLPTIQNDLRTTQDSVTWVLTAYLLSASVFTPLLGRAGDHFGKQRMMVLSLAGLTVGSVVAAAAPNIDTMVAARVIQGLGGGVLPLAFGIIRDEFPSDRVASAISVVASLMAVGAGAGLVLAGPLVSALTYRSLFLIPGLVTAVSAIATMFFVPRSPTRTSGPLGALPAVLLSAWLVTLLLVLNQGHEWGWDSKPTLGLTSAAVILAHAWVKVEQRADSPLIDMRMMRLPGVWTANLVALLVGFGMYAAFAFLPQFSQTAGTNGYGFGASVTESGLLMLPSSATMFVLGLVSARVARRVGAKRVVVTGSLVMAASMGIVAFAHNEVWQIALASGVLGSGVGLVFACLSALIVEAVPAHQTGAASGINANIRTVGGAIGGAVMGTIVTSRMYANGVPHESGYTNGFLALMCVMLVCAGLALLIPRVIHADGQGHGAAVGRAGAPGPARDGEFGDAVLQCLPLHAYARKYVDRTMASSTKPATE